MHSMLPNLEEVSACFKFFDCRLFSMIFVVSCMFLILSLFLSCSIFFVISVNCCMLRHMLRVLRYNVYFLRFVVLLMIFFLLIRIPFLVLLDIISGGGLHVILRHCCCSLVKRYISTIFVYTLPWLRIWSSASHCIVWSKQLAALASTWTQIKQCSQVLNTLSSYTSAATSHQLKLMST